MENPFNRLPISPQLKKTLPYILSLILFVAVLVGVFIASESTNQPVTSNPTDNLGLMAQSSPADITFDLIIKIVFVFALIYLFFALLKWWQKKQPGLSQNRLRVIETVRPSPRQTFYLIKVGSQEFLIGATDQSINLISEIDPELIEETGDNELNVTPPNATPSFKSVLFDSLKPGLNLFKSNKSDDDKSNPPTQGIK